MTLVPRGRSVVTLLLLMPLTSRFVLKATPLVRNSTLPVAVDGKVAMKFTESLKPAGFFEEETVTDVLALVTVSDCVAEVMVLGEALAAVIVGVSDLESV